MKKVLQINILNETGSTGRIVQQISKCLNENGYDSYTAYGYGKSDLINAYKIGNKLEYVIHNISSKLFGAQGHFSYFSTKRLIHYMRSNQFELVHLHNIHGNYINYKLLFKYLSKENIPVIWTLHDCWAFTGKCVYFTDCNCNKWKRECRNCPILEDYPKSYFFDRSKKDFKLKKKLTFALPILEIVTPSQWLKDLVGESYLNNRNCIVINNGIDLNAFRYTESNLKEIYHLESKKIILGVANPWNKRKGFEDFVKLSKMISSDYKIVLIGVSHKQMEHLPDSILAINKTSNTKELAEWYSIADVFVNPTYEDNFPTVNMEAIACDTPVVSYDTGGCKEVVKEPYGKLCKTGDINELINLIYIITQKGKINGYEYIYRYYNKDFVYYQYIDIYNRLLKEN